MKVINRFAHVGAVAARFLTITARHSWALRHWRKSQLHGPMVQAFPHIL